MVHKIAPESKRIDESITTERLREYCRYLKKHNYKVFSLTDYVQALINGHKTYKTVVFTVDDGYRDFYDHAYPVFREFNYPVTIFITSDFIEGKLFFWWDTIEYAISSTSKQEIDLSFMNREKMPLTDKPSKNRAITSITQYCKKLENKDKLELIGNLVKELEVDISGQPKGKYAPLSWDEIRDMQKDGIEFYPHTKTHPIMSHTTTEQKQEELAIPKKILEEKLNIKADIFCYPNGTSADFDEETIELLKSTGYIAAVTGMGGFDNTKSKVDMFRLHRFGLPDHPIWFKQFICGLEAFKFKLKGQETAEINPPQY